MSRSKPEQAPRVPEADYVLREYEATEPLDRERLSERGLTTIDEEINDSETRLRVEYRLDGRAKIHATQHVGIVTLSNGPTIEIRPKIHDTDLIGLLKYGQGVTPRTIEEETSITAGRRFIDALAALFEAELETVLSRGLHRDYRRRREAVSHVRGRLDVQRQLQRQGPMPTEFECTYDELTVDTTVNRAILYATTVLLRLVRDTDITRSLRRHQQRLRRRVELSPVRPVEIEHVELTRLATYYEDLFRLTKLVLKSVYVENLRAADRSSFALLVDMNQIFEAVVERAVADSISDRPGWSVEGQVSSRKLVSGGARPIQIRPDVLVSDRDGTVQFVGDAKWKLDDPDTDGREPSTNDIFQLVSYQVAHQSDGVLFYPEQGGRVASRYDVHTLDPLTLVEVPVRGVDGRSIEQDIRHQVSEQLPI